MKIAILDVVPEVHWADDEGRNDGDKFAAMLQKTGIDATLTVHCITKDDWPAAVDSYDAYLVSGSPCSANLVYDWTPRFTILIGKIIQQKIRLAGICFGHQFIARCLGARVERSQTGWLIGRHPLTVIDHQPWMTPPLTDTHIYYFNQDQVATLPVEAKHLGTAPNCRYAAWCFEDRIFCIQGHPEQGIDSMRNFIRATRKTIDHQRLDEAERSMQDMPTDADTWALWIRNFLTGKIP